MGFFDLTETDLQDGKAKFSNGDSAVLQITKVVKKEVNDKMKIIVETVVMDGANTGMKHSLWFSVGSEGGRKALGIFLTAFMSAADAATMDDPNVLINRKFSTKFVDNNGFLSERYIKEVSDVPAGIPAAPAAPVAQPVPAAPAQTEVAPQPTINKSLFG